MNSSIDSNSHLFQHRRLGTKSYNPGKFARSKTSWGRGSTVLTYSRHHASATGQVTEAYERLAHFW